MPPGASCRHLRLDRSIPKSRTFRPTGALVAASLVPFAAGAAWVAELLVVTATKRVAPQEWWFGTMPDWQVWSILVALGKVIVIAFLGWESIYPICAFPQGVWVFWTVVGVTRIATHACASVRGTWPAVSPTGTPRSSPI